MGQNFHMCLRSGPPRPPLTVSLTVKCPCFWCLPSIHSCLKKASFPHTRVWRLVSRHTDIVAVSMFIGIGLKKLGLKKSLSIRQKNVRPNKSQLRSQWKFWSCHSVPFTWRNFFRFIACVNFKDVISITQGPVYPGDYGERHFFARSLWTTTFPKVSVSRSLFW